MIIDNDSDPETLNNCFNFHCSNITHIILLLEIFLYLNHFFAPRNMANLEYIPMVFIAKYVKMFVWSFNNFSDPLVSDKALTFYLSFLES